MTERLADISARIGAIRQLGAVVNAMKGIAAARAQAARAQIGAVDSYAGTIATALISVQPDVAEEDRRSGQDPASDTTGHLVFCAEQGFAGAFSERVLSGLMPAETGDPLLLVGTRGLAVARSRGLEPVWSDAMPSHTLGVPNLAGDIAAAIFELLDTGRISRLDVIHAGWQAGQVQVVRRFLFPLDLSEFPRVASTPPLMQLPAGELIAKLGADYLHAQLCKSALHAFAAENEARMQAMASASSQIATELTLFEAKLRRVRQEAITAEIIELGTGAAMVRKAGRER